MKPPYDISPKILKLITAISEKIGEVNANYLTKQSPQLRKQNRIKTIHSSLQIEGNTLTEEQITALIENKRVIGPEKEVLEVLNAIRVYEKLEDYKLDSDKSFLKAHLELMQGLIESAGKYRKQGVGIMKGSKVEHVAPPYENVPYLMKDLFEYVKDSEELTLIKSCVFHYEMEFIHPFLDGNGRMGRLWQTLILMSEYPVFEFLPFETLISQTQNEYYQALAMSDKSGKSTFFIEYMLQVIDKSLGNLLNYNNRVLKDIDRLDYFLKLGIKEFTRKDYMNTFKDLSSATASRDLKKGVELQLFESSGTQNKTQYSVK
ncbi:cell filamentation protein Fic [Flavobacterium alvei]|uniref:Cell filamentation protein Fic n=1 Tax=Flavobacterium alvei TaxID=2080416 RepID=A0A2S5AE87_9FLAO|nr:Fic family protein [Flavobacterium alvei]POY40609.1 cell filamentation protein Fic [Flavobacterium alvei]HQF47220.1 Fic family protein [Flavobacterium alvei]HQK39884.1 Fic family protein [Flavobacterium alvei]